MPRGTRRRIARDVQSGLLTINEACLHIGVSRRTIYNWIKAGTLAAVLTPSGSKRISVAP